MVSVVPGLDQTQGFVVEALDAFPAASGEVYHLELNQGHVLPLTFEIRSMNIWIEVIGRT